MAGFGIGSVESSSFATTMLVKFCNFCQIFRFGNYLPTHPQKTEITVRIGEITGSHGGEYEDDCLLRCCAYLLRKL
jgi:hypothetical protein